MIIIIKYALNWSFNMFFFNLDLSFKINVEWLYFWSPGLNSMEKYSNISNLKVSKILESFVQK